MAKTTLVKKEEQTGSGGSIQIGLDPALQIVMNFDKPVPGVTFSPEQAEQIGVSLIQHAALARLQIKQNEGPVAIRARTH